MFSNLFEVFVSIRNRSPVTHFHCCVDYKENARKDETRVILYTNLFRSLNIPSTSNSSQLATSLYQDNMKFNSFCISQSLKKLLRVSLLIYYSWIK